MSRWLALVLALCAFGCEDTYVREHIIGNFVCVYMPWWMGECDGEEVTNKVMGVLDHGLVAAEITCGTCGFASTNTCGGGSSVFSLSGYQAHKLVDGSCLSGTNGMVSYFHSRGQSGAEECQASGYSAHDGHLYGDFGPCESVTPIAIETCCTGFNLEAFGVEE